jgi:DNA-directed RNA polymerase specialized sigma24 family protein
MLTVWQRLKTWFQPKVENPNAWADKILQNTRRDNSFDEYRKQLREEEARLRQEDKDELEREEALKALNNEKENGND